MIQSTEVEYCTYTIRIVFINENAQTTTTWHTTQTQYGKRKPNTKDAMNFVKIH